MATYTFATHLHSARFNADWSVVTETYSTPEVKLLSGSDHVSYTPFDQIDGAGLYLETPNGMMALEFEPVFVQRIKWAGTYTDVLQIAAHVRDAAGNVIGFDTYYIELGGTPLSVFATEPEFAAFLAAASFVTPPGGWFVPGAEFKWAEAMGLEQIDGTAAGETLAGGRLGDLIFGQGGNDMISGYLGNDTLDGGTGSDRIRGEAGNDRLLGARGADKLFGGVGDDTLIGGAGNDTLDGGIGNDVMTGGLNADSFVFAKSGGTDRITDFNVGQGDRLQLNSALWGGGLTVFDVITQFASFAQPDRVIFSFAGGETLSVIENMPDGLVGLHGAIDII